MNTIIKFLAGTSLCCMISSMAVSCSNEENRTDVITDINDFVEGENHNILIAYFSEPLPENGADAVTSASRVTVGGNVYGSVQYMATVIADATGGDLARIRTVIPYAENFDELAERADQERQNDVHPEISVAIDDFDSYDVIFVGYPIWWGHAPSILLTFLDDEDLSGKTIIPFCTSSSSRIGNSATDLAEYEGDGNWLDGMRFRSRVSEGDIREWLEELGY